MNYLQLPLKNFHFETRRDEIEFDATWAIEERKILDYYVNFGESNFKTVYEKIVPDEEKKFIRRNRFGRYRRIARKFNIKESKIHKKILKKKHKNNKVLF